MLFSEIVRVELTWLVIACKCESWLNGDVSDALTWQDDMRHGRRLLLLLAAATSVIPSQETTIYSTSLYFINWRGHISAADVLRPTQTKLSAGDRRHQRLPLISNIWCTQMTGVIIWSPASSIPTDAAAGAASTYNGTVGDIYTGWIIGMSCHLSY